MDDRNTVKPAYLSILMLSLVVVLAAADAPSQELPDWIPVGTVSPPLVRHSLEAMARLQSRNPGQQRAALQLLQSDIREFGKAEMRIAAVPLVAELLSQEYRILGFPDDYRVDTTIRLSALDVLAEVGGESAREHIRYSLLHDNDGAIRSHAARLLATVPGTDPDGDLAAVSQSLLRAVRGGADEAEVSRTLDAAAQLSREAWSPDVPDLVRSLVLIHEGNFSRRIRRSAMALLEELANR